jgi:hypothetical protein
MPDAFEHLKSATRPRLVHGVAMLDRDDPVPIAPDDHGGQFGRQMQPIQCADGLPAVVHHRAQRP